jgi:thioredoxin reductase (NADPH)
MTDEIDLNWELIVIGGGPAGMTAAMYGARYGLKTMLLESRVLGGAQATSPGIENYPGFNFIIGMDLANKMKEQLKKCGAQYKEITEVKSIKILEDSGDFALETRRGEYIAKAIVVATGGGHRKLDVPGEDEFTGRGVSFCATCDGPLFRGKTLAVIGGGNTAITEALYLSELAGKVYVIHRRDALRAEQAVQDMLFRTDAEIVWDHVVKEFHGEQLISDILIENVKSGETLVKPLEVKMNKRGEIFTDGEQKTNVQGLFAAGDVVDGMKQIVVAAGQGAIAADSAYKYIRKEKTGPR